jgi:dihydrofolate reductase
MRREHGEEAPVRVSVFIATSFDGFIAREDGALDWLPTGTAGEDYGYGRFMESVDALVMGRVTFETVRGLGDWPYGNLPVFVLSASGVDVPDGLAGSVQHLSCSPADVVRTLSDRGMRHVYVDGGRTIGGFLAAGLVHELTITRIPVLLGRGIPLFQPRSGDIRLRHVRTRSFPDGLVQSTYEVVTEQPG